MELVTMKLSQIKPYPNNPRLNNDAVKAVMESIQQCTYIAPIIVDDDNVILAGHTRYKAMKKLGWKKCEVIVKEGLTEEQKRKYRLLDNKTNELADWDFDMLAVELEGLDFGDLDLDWGLDSDFEDGLNAARNNGQTDEEYDEFVDKFKPKLTTDDCFTPPLVYEAVRQWAVKEYGWHDRKIIRPFYPGGDYRNEQYPDGCCVIDNPPFSIMSEIVSFYEENGIDYFLFAPHLTVLGIRKAKSRVVTSAAVVYENGANVSTSFVCSQGPCVRSCPELYTEIKRAVEEAKETVELPKYNYPKNLVTASVLAAFSKFGIEYSEDRTYFVRELDAQKEKGCAIFGGGFLVPEEPISEAIAREAAAREAIAREAAAREAAAREANEYTFQLSDREREIVSNL